MEKSILSLTIFFFMLLLSNSCTKGKVDNRFNELVTARELIYKQEKVIDSLNNINSDLQDSLNILNNKLQSLDALYQFKNSQLSILSDSLNYYKEDALVYRYKIERIKAYDKIVRNNSSQSKFFLGWVRRVLED